MEIKLMIEIDLTRESMGKHLMSVFDFKDRFGPEGIKMDPHKQSVMPTEYQYDYLLQIVNKERHIEHLENLKYDIASLDLHLEDVHNQILAGKTQPNSESKETSQITEHMMQIMKSPKFIFLFKVKEDMNARLSNYSLLKRIAQSSPFDHDVWYMPTKLSDDGKPCVSLAKLKEDPDNIREFDREPGSVFLAKLEVQHKELQKADDATETSPVTDEIPKFIFLLDWWTTLPMRFKSGDLLCLHRGEGYCFYTTEPPMENPITYLSSVSLERLREHPKKIVEFSERPSEYELEHLKREEEGIKKLKSFTQPDIDYPDTIVLLKEAESEVGNDQTFLIFPKGSRLIKSGYKSLFFNQKGLWLPRGKESVDISRLKWSDWVAVPSDWPETTTEWPEFLLVTDKIPGSMSNGADLFPDTVLYRMNPRKDWVCYSTSPDSMASNKLIELHNIDFRKVQALEEDPTSLSSLPF